MLFHVALPVRGYNILSAFPVHDVALGGAALSVAVLGLRGEMAGACALLGSEVGVTENGARMHVWVALKALGVLGVWVSDLGERSVDDGMLALVLGRVVPRRRVRVLSLEGVGEGAGGGCGGRVEGLGASFQVEQ
jgi:hypothetical protein